MLFFCGSGAAGAEIETKAKAMIVNAANNALFIVPLRKCGTDFSLFVRWNRLKPVPHLHCFSASLIAI